MLGLFLYLRSAGSIVAHLFSSLHTVYVLYIPYNAKILFSLFFLFLILFSYSPYPAALCTSFALLSHTIHSIHRTYIWLSPRLISIQLHTYRKKKKKLMLNVISYKYFSKRGIGSSEGLMLGIVYCASCPCREGNARKPRLMHEPHST